MLELNLFSEQRYDAFCKNNREGPMQLLNLVRLRSVAAYEDGRVASGLEAYHRYGQETASLFASVGGHIAWRGTPELLMMGPTDERWDICFIAEYPSPAAFIALLSDPVYSAAVVHRHAAAEDSRLIRLMTAEPGNSFSG